jgi:hypothetical protein
MPHASDLLRCRLSHVMSAAFCLNLVSFPQSFAPPELTGAPTGRGATTPKREGSTPFVHCGGGMVAAEDARIPISWARLICAMGWCSWGARSVAVAEAGATHPVCRNIQCCGLSHVHILVSSSSRCIPEVPCGCTKQSAVLRSLCMGFGRWDCYRLRPIDCLSVLGGRPAGEEFEPLG